MYRDGPVLFNIFIFRQLNTFLLGRNIDILVSRCIFFSSKISDGHDLVKA